MFKFISEDSVLLTYGKWGDYDRLTFFFNKELQNVDIDYKHFEFNEGCHFVPQEQIKQNFYPCKYGYWRCETPTLSMEDIEFLHNKAKELWGK